MAGSSFQEVFSPIGIGQAVTEFVASRTYRIGVFGGKERPVEKIPSGVDRIKHETLFERTPSGWAFQDEKLPHLLSAQILGGEYVFKPFGEEKKIKEVDLHGNPKAYRTISVCCVQDALIQYISLKKLAEDLDDKFSDNSFAYRPKRSVATASRRVVRLLESGWTWVGESDIKSFFDEVNHQILRETLERKLPTEPREFIDLLESFYTARRVKARRIKRFGGLHRLPVGFPYDKISCDRTKGLPQGGALSGILANLILDDFDHFFDEEQPELRFVRYADDFLILAKCREKASQGLELARSRLAPLKLALHPKKTFVSSAYSGFQFIGHHFRARRGEEALITIRKKNLDRRYRMLEDIFETGLLRGRCPCQVRSTLFHKAVGMYSRKSPGSEPMIRSWVAFFSGINDTSQLRELDAWIRSRFRAYQRDFQRQGGELCNTCRATMGILPISYTRLYYLLKRARY